MVRIAGVEEAGRGPVIGPMVMAIAVIDADKEQELVRMGVKDSKLLTPNQREALYGLLKDMVEYHTVILPPETIDHACTSPDLNLNWLEARTSAELIDKVKADKVILDCPSNNKEAYKAYVMNLLKVPPKELIAEHKADVLFPIVSAASIIAKVLRDRAIQALKEEFKVEFGSGYPADPITSAFLKENYDKYPFFRKSWASYKNVLKAKNQKTLGGF